MKADRRQIFSRQNALITLTLLTIIGASLPPFMIASCQTRQRANSDSATLDNLRTLTRHNSLPSEADIARIEAAHANTSAGALARMIHARVRFNANDFKSAAALLDDKMFARYTSIADYALMLRAEALAQAGNRVEARAAFEGVARDYPRALRTHDAIIRDAELAGQDGQYAAVPAILKQLNDTDDGRALFLTAEAYEKQGDSQRALATYRRVYFYAPNSGSATSVAALLSQKNSSTAPSNPAEAQARADRLYEARNYGGAAAAYAEAFTMFPVFVKTESQLQRGIAALRAGGKYTADAIASLNAIPATAGELHAEALFYVAQAYARSRQWPKARAAGDELLRSYPQDNRGVRALVAAGIIARDAKLAAEAANFFRAAVAAAPGTAEVAQAQFELAWAAHDNQKYQDSGRLLLEHLASYADKNTDNRGRAGYWAGRDLERSGHTAEARAIYEAMQVRYDANWYGYLAKQRFDVLAGSGPQSDVAADSEVSRAVANLMTVSIAEETAGSDADAVIRRAVELNIVGLDQDALRELEPALAVAPRSPRLNLARARVLRSNDDNLQALLTMQKSYPDYSQMKPEELTPEEWDVFYPLSNWQEIMQESKRHSLDPYTVAGLIRQETIFDPHAKSSANAYGIMQLLLDTAQRTARKYGLPSPASADALYDPILNIKLGTAYLRDQMDQFGRIEYVAAAYNAGPNRLPQWRASLPSEMDEWVEAVPFKETRSYIQGVVRNRLQYLRLYDREGRFKPEVGSRAVSRPNAGNEDPSIRKISAPGGAEE